MGNVEVFHAYTLEFKRVELSETDFYNIHRKVDVKSAKSDYPVVVGVVDSLARFIKVPSQTYYKKLLDTIKDKKIYHQRNDKGFIVCLEEENIQIKVNKKGHFYVKTKDIQIFLNNKGLYTMKAKDFINLLIELKYYL